MAEATPEVQVEAQVAEKAPDSSPEEVNWQDKAEAQQKVNRDLERKLKAAQADIEKARQAGMTEAEKAIADAEARGRTSAATEFGKRLARTEFDAAAGRRNPGFDMSAALEYVDLSKFLDESGEPDTKAIKAAVERLVPEPSNGPPSFDGGARSSTKAQNFNDVLRQAVGRA